MANVMEVKNIGPVEHVAIPVPEDGGIVVLRGRNGSGKTKTLEAVEAAAAGKGGLSVRDGQLRGEVKALGVTLKVGRATRRTGELEVETLDGRLNVADLVDPGIKSPDAADARRIKALVQVAGVQADASLFYDLAGGKEQFCNVVGCTAVETDDLVAMADRIKRDLEAAARTAESKAKHAHAAAEAAKQATEGVDLGADSDGDMLQERLERAVSERSALVARAEDTERRHEQARQADRRLRELSASYTGPTVDEASMAERQASTEVDLFTAVVTKLEGQLRECRAGLAQAKANHKLAVQTCDAAEHHDELIAECKQLAEGDLPAPIGQEQLDQAEAAVTTARQAVEQGATVRFAKRKIGEAQQLAAEAKQHAEQSARLRDAARSTDEVLSGVVARTGSPLRVEAGRLVLDTGRGVTYFGDLSHGERWKLALDIAIDAVGENGLLVIPQDAFESLDPINRAEIAEHVRGRGVVILTAEASEDEQIGTEVL